MCELVIDRIPSIGTSGDADQILYILSGDLRLGANSGYWSGSGWFASTFRTGAIFKIRTGCLAGPGFKSAFLF